MPTALITGITGQDGSYLAEYLLERDYEVYGLVRRSATKDYWRIDHLLGNGMIELVEGDMTDQVSLNRAVAETEPDEVYNLAAQSFVGTSFKQPLYTMDVTGMGVVRILEAVRTHVPEARFYQASTSEMFGDVDESPQDESTEFHPRSPYGVAKLMGHWATINYREAYDMYAVSGILFNHESPRRGVEFVTRKITLAAARIAAGSQDELRLGNLEAKRDWGDAREYVAAMHAMLQQPPEEIDDYVIGTGETNTVQRCVEVAFDEVGLDPDDYVVIDDEFYRPADVHVLQADASLAASELDWKTETDFEELIRDMVKRGVERVRRDDKRWIEPETGVRPQSTLPEETD